MSLAEDVFKLARSSRVSSHKKQERLHIKAGVPTVRELKEGVPSLRNTDEGLVEYVRFGSDLYKKVLERASIASVSIIDASLLLVDIRNRINEILAVLRDKGIIKMN